MANLTFPIKITSRGGSNREVMEALKTGRLAYPPGFLYWHRVRLRFAVGDFSPAAATSQEIDLNVTYPNVPFPADVVRCAGTFCRVVTPISGASISAGTIQIGDTADPNGLQTAVDIFTAAGVLHSTPAAAENARRGETAFAPTATITLTGGDVDEIEAGEVIIYIPWRKLVP